MPEIQATIVFEKNWNAIHEKCPECAALGITPHRDCSWCHGSGRKYKYIKNRGSSRSSKTHSIAQIFYLYAINNKGKRLSVFRDTKIDCRETVGKDMEKIYPSMPFANTVSFNKTEAVYRFGLTQSTIEIEGTDDANRIHGYNGDVTWLCEPYDISEVVFDQLDMRTSEFVLLDLNPKMQHWSDKLDMNPRTIVIKSTFKDNPYCPPEQRIKILSYQPLKLFSGVLDKVMTIEEAKTYDVVTNPKQLPDKQIKELSRCIENERKKTSNEFNWVVYGLGEKAEKPNRIFNWEEIPDEQYHAIQAKKYYGTDWGIVDPWAIGEIKYYDGALYVHELNYRSENEIRQSLTVDQLMKINKDEEGLVSWVFNNLKIDRKATIVCDTNRPMKITALWAAGYSYAIGAPKPPGSIIDGINLLQGLRVYYTKSSINLAMEQENYEREVDRYGVVLEEPMDKNNHLIDQLRYVALYLQMMGVIKVS